VIDRRKFVTAVAGALLTLPPRSAKLER